MPAAACNVHGQGGIRYVIMMRPDARRAAAMLCHARRGASGRRRGGVNV